MSASDSMTWDEFKAANPRRGDLVQRVATVKKNGYLKETFTTFRFSHFAPSKWGDEVVSDKDAYFSGALVTGAPVTWRILERAKRSEEDYPLGTILPFQSDTATGRFIRHAKGWAFSKGQPPLDHRWSDIVDHHGPYVLWDEATIPGEDDK